MLIAEIRRKLADLEDIDPQEGDVVEQVRTLLRETKEDLLTADVFGLLKYLPRVPYLQTVLQAIADRNPHCEDFANLVDNLGIDIESSDFQFWPSYPTPEGIPGSTTEPDVQISAPNLLVFFEAKLHSGFGEHQVERELTAGLDQAGEREFFLVLVTPSIFPPRIAFEGKRLSVQDYLHSVSKLRTITKKERDRIKANSNRVLWINWNVITSALDAAYSKHRGSSKQRSAEKMRVGDMLGDLDELMRMRGLSQFAGFSHILRRHTTTLRPGMRVMPGLGEIIRSRAIDLSTVVRQFTFTDYENRGFLVMPRRKPQKTIPLDEIVKNREVEGNVNELFHWRTRG